MRGKKTEKHALNEGKEEGHQHEIFMKNLLFSHGLTRVLTAMGAIFRKSKRINVCAFARKIVFF